MSPLAGGQFYPLRINRQNGEPFLRLKRHKDIRVTPPRLGDAPALCSLMNHPLVYEWSQIPTMPYRLEQAEETLLQSKNASNGLLVALQQAQDQSEAKVVGSCPVEFIREVQQDGIEILIGGIHFTRCDFGEFLGPEGPNVIRWEHKDEYREENFNLETGDPEIVWTMGVYLAPAYHGRGIMTDAVNTLLYDWAIPRMGVRRILVFTFEGNHASVKVFLRNRFKFLFTSREHLTVRGMVRSVNVLEWKLDDEDELTESLDGLNAV